MRQQNSNQKRKTKQRKNKKNKIFFIVLTALFRIATLELFCIDGLSGRTSNHRPGDQKWGV
jgi:hypothetical protein